MVLALAFFIYRCDTTCPPPNRPRVVPANSKWIGGCDGGYWVEMVDSLSRIRIYAAITGELEMDADFVPDKDCFIKSLRQGQITSVDPEQVILKISESKYCKLKLKLPAYGGSNWELMKEKK